MTAILIVDDRPVNRERLISLLGYGGHRLLEAADGASALALLRAERPDLVITDILMPTMDGYEFAQIVRGDPDPALAGTPIIFYTATYNAPESKALAKAAGVQYVIAKPATPQLILQTVNSALGLTAPAPEKMKTSPLLDPLEVVNSKLTEKVGELSGLERRLEALLDLVVRLSTEREAERLLQTACDSARTIVGARYAAIGILADDRQSLRHFVTSGMEAETIARIGPLPMGKGVLGKLLAEGKPLRLADLTKDPSSVGFPPGHPPMRSFLGVPIALPTGNYGRLYLSEKIGAVEFSVDDERLAVALAAPVAVAYENTLRYDEIQRHAARLQLEMGQRKKAEAELAESEERFRSWVENAMDLITVIDAQGLIRYESPSIERLLGYTPAELVGTSAFELVHPDDLAQLRKQFTQKMGAAGARAMSEFRLHDREGNWRDFEATGKTIPDRNGQPVALLYARDISERKQAEEARARLVEIIEATPDFVGWANPAGQVVYVNRAGRQMLGMGTAEDIRSSQISDYVPAWANDLVVPEAISAAIAKGSWTGESALLTRDGREIPVSQVILAHYGPDGSPRYISTIARDISERKQAEAVLQTYARQEAAVADMGQRALAETNLASLMDAVAARVAETLDVPFCEVMELAPGGDSLRLRAGVGWRDGVVGQASVGAGKSSQAGYTLAMDGAVVSDDLGAETRFDVPTLLREHGAASGMSVAIRRSQSVFGVLGAFTSQPRKFSADEVHFLEAVANLLGQAVEREQAKAALAEERNVLRTLIDNLPDAIYVKDRQSRFVVKNLADARKMGAASPDETVGKTDFDYYSAELAGRYYADDQAVVQSGQAIVNREEPIVDAAGQAGWVSTTKVPLRDSQGQVIGLVGIGHDITGRKQHERELEAIVAVSNALRSAMTRDEMSPIILDQLLSLFDAQGAALDLYDPAERVVTIDSARGAWEALTGRQMDANDSIIGQVLAAGEHYVHNDAQNEPRLFAGVTSESVRAVACVPIIAQGRVFGGLWVGRPTPFGDDDVRVLSAIADMAGNAMQRAALHEQTERRLERLAALRVIDIAISSTLDVSIALNVVLDQVVSSLHADAADVLLLNPRSQSLEHKAGRGFRAPDTRRASQRLGLGYAGQIALDRRPVNLPDLGAAAPDRSQAGQWAEEGFQAYFGVPLVAKGLVVGVLEVFQRTPLRPDQEWLDFLEALAGQAAIAIDNAALFNDLQQSNQNLNLAYDATIEGWSRALDLRDRETEGHSQRVTELTLRLADRMGLEPAQMVHIRRGALLHDIGKMGVPDNILLKPGPLTEAEWVIMRQHPGLAFEMLAPIEYLRPALDIPYCHHEKWDGTGYPRGLKGEAIPLAARIFAVVDVWDALRSDRPYRRGWAEAQVREYIRAQAGKHFDPEVVAAFEQLLGDEG